MRLAVAHRGHRRDQRLIDGEARRREHESFEIPSRQKRSALSPGWLVKIGLSKVGRIGMANGCVGERFWVRIESIEPGPLYTGVLLADLAIFRNYRRGDRIVFEPPNVLALDE